MVIFSHILFSAAGVKVMGLQGHEIFLAYTFGVLPDIDHIIKLPLFLKKHRSTIADILGRGFPKEKYYHWRTPLQEPVALLWIVPFSFFIGSFVPIIFFLSHLLLDYLVSYRKMPFFPFHYYSTNGFLTKIPDGVKQIIVFILLLCLNLSLL